MFFRLQFLLSLPVLLGSFGPALAFGSSAPAVTTLTDDNFESAISECLSRDSVDGLCSSSGYGSMPDWDVSLVTGMIEAFKGRTGFKRV